MKRTKQELIEIVTNYIGDRNDDLSISLLEDISDSYPDDIDTTDWQKKLDDLDKEWRGRYMSRFNEPINTGDSGDNGDKDKDTVDEGDNEDVGDISEDDMDIDDLFADVKEGE